MDDIEYKKYPLFGQLCKNLDKIHRKFVSDLEKIDAENPSKKCPYNCQVNADDKKSNK